MLKSRNFRIFISLIMAILLWAYVVGSVETTTTKTLRNVPISFSHTAELGERGLAVYSSSEETIDLEVSGSRVALSEMSANDITALVDMASAAKGENEQTIIVRVPSGVVVKDRSATRTTVVVEALAQKMVDVKVEYQGNYEDGEAPITDEVSPGKISVSGAESLVKSVESVVATAEAGMVTRELTSDTLQIHALNEAGEPVEGVVLSQESVSVKSILSITEPREVQCNIVDRSTDDMVRTVEVPQELLITGRSDLLSDITVLKAKDLIITGLTESGDMPITIELPEGVTLSEANPEPTASLSVKEMETKAFTFGSQEIEIIGSKEGFNYTLPEDTVITVRAVDAEDILRALEKQSISVSIDVSDLSTGISSVDISVKCSSAIHSITSEPETVSVTVRNNSEADSEATNG